VVGLDGAGQLLVGQLHQLVDGEARHRGGLAAGVVVETLGAVILGYVNISFYFLVMNNFPSLVRVHQHLQRPPLLGITLYRPLGYSHFSRQPLLAFLPQLSRLPLLLEVFILHLIIIIIMV
jgi:hypothetical protein